MLEQRLNQSQDLRLQQRLALTQEMQQAIHILQLSSVELEQYIQEELETNPVLEQKPKEPEPEPAAKADANDEEETAFDESFDLDAYATRWERRHHEGRDLSYNPDLAARRQFYQDSLTTEESFSARLLTQLRLTMKDPTDYAIGERIIGDIDDRGYFTGSVEEIAKELDVPVEDVEYILSRVQRFEPTGVGARDIKECLLLQIKVEYPDEPQLLSLIHI